MLPLSTYANLDTDYVSKLNADNAAIVSAVTAVETGKQDTSAKGQPNGYAALDSGGLLPTGSMPSGVELTVNKGANNGYCPLDSTGKVPTANLPSTGGGGGGTTPFYVPMFFPGKPPNAALITKIVLPAGVTFPASLTGSLGDVGTVPTASTSLAVAFYRAGSPQQTGTITISTGGAFTFAMSASFTSQAGDVLKVTNQATADATCADISATLSGTR
jgi:hypothetical protein